MFFSYFFIDTLEKVSIKSEDMRYTFEIIYCCNFIATKHNKVSKDMIQALFRYLPSSND